MDNKVMNATKREETGKGPAKRYRMQGFIPAIMYGYRGVKNIVVKRTEFESIFEEIGGHSIIALNIGNDENVDVIVKDYQLDPVKKNLIHLDFLEIESGKVLKTEVPIKVIGESEGIKIGGILEEFIKEVSIECLPKDIPELIEIDISDLNLGDSFHVSELKLKESIKILDNPDQVILTIGVPSKVTETTEEVEEEVEAVASPEKVDEED